MRAVLAAIAAVAAFAGLVFGLNLLGFANFAFFAPRYEAVRRDTMIESRAYSEATVRELYALKRQYEAAATDEQRATIRAAALHEFSIFPRERLPSDLALWLAALDR